MTSAPAPPPADDKDWTWVLDTTCPECGFVAESVSADQVADRLRENIEAWRAILTDADTTRLRQRPDADHWSALEYACHVRDVFAIYDERLVLMLTEEGPHYPNWDQNVTAVEDRYDLADPSVVLDQLIDAGSRLADRFDQVAADQWGRMGYRSDGAAFTIESFARYFIHDPLHHVDDVQKGYRRLAS
ncbi:MAG: DinB family protein [Acidimicrobiales bacterium]